MSEVRAAIFRGAKAIEHVALDASMPQYGDSVFIWIEALNPLDRDLAVLQGRFGLPDVIRGWAKVAVKRWPSADSTPWSRLA